MGVIRVQLGSEHQLQGPGPSTLVSVVDGRFLILSNIRVLCLSCYPGKAVSQSFYLCTRKSTRSVQFHTVAAGQKGGIEWKNLISRYGLKISRSEIDQIDRLLIGRSPL